MTRPYLDAGFLITLLVKTNGSAVANETVTQVEAPCRVTRFHEFQVRTFLAQGLHSQDASQKTASEKGDRLWRWFLTEGVFELVDIDWSAALASATQFVEEDREIPPAPLLVLHPILATYSGASHFLSFDPRSRRIAGMLGLKVLPERL